MQTATIPELTEKFVVPAATSSYPTLGTAYKLPKYSINHSLRLERTGKNYRDTKAGIPEGIWMSTAAEETAIQLAIERDGKDSRKAKVFDDLFGRNNDSWYAWQWTETGLRVPKGHDPNKYETDSQGRKYWPRIVLIGDREVGEVLVPEGNGRVVVEWDEVFGLAKITEDIPYLHKGYTTHSWFDPMPRKDDISGHYDFAVGRGCGWFHGGGCLGVVVGYRRWAAVSAAGFRSVRGSFEIQAERTLRF